jgi:hypothetical protein
MTPCDDSQDGKATSFPVLLFVSRHELFVSNPRNLTAPRGLDSSRQILPKTKLRCAPLLLEAIADVAQVLAADRRSRFMSQFCPGAAWGELTIQRDQLV